MKFFEDRYIAFNRKHYEDEVAMWSDVRAVMEVLVRNGYETLFEYEDAGVYVLRFCSKGMGRGFYLLDEDEWCEVVFRRSGEDEGEEREIGPLDARIIQG